MGGLSRPFRLLLSALLLHALMSAGVAAQERPPALPLLPNELAPLLERQEEGRERTPEPDLRPESRSFAPQRAEPAIVELSDIERSFSERAGRPLRLVGRQAFGMPRPVSLRQTGAIPDDYILGIGDEVVVVLRGQVNRTVRARINREGGLILPELPPVPAAGLRFGELREAVRAQVEANYAASEAFVSLGEVRQITVLVNGEVRSPGPVALNSLASVVDALLLAGGVRPAGSLRNLQVLRDRRTATVDLYNLVLGRQIRRNDYSIAEGDQIFVPVLGATAAVAGQVKREGIFELPPGAAAIDARRLLDLAGGIVGRGPYSYVVLRILRDGREDMVELPGLAGQTIQDGDILLVRPVVQAEVGRVTLTGHVRLPRDYPTRSAPRLGDLIGRIEVYKDNPYLLFGIVSRVDRETFGRRLVYFNPADIIARRGDVPLQDGDIVRIFGFSEIRRILDRPPPGDDARDAAARDPRFADPDGAGGERRPARGTAAAFDPGADRPEDRAAAERRPEPRRTAPERRSEAEELGGGLVAEVGLRRILMDRAVSLVGAVLAPGRYPVADSVSLEDLLRSAGGTTHDADPGAIEVTRLLAQPGADRVDVERFLVDQHRTPAASIRLQPRDVVRVNPRVSGREEGFILVEGQVRRPGRYDILVGERLSSILQRAGGLRDSAYPYGAVYMRESVREAERAARQRALAELNRALLRESTTRSDRQLSADAIAVLNELIGEIERSEALGRIVVETDPNVLRARPELDILVEPGDRLYVPRRPSSVLVSGEVFNPGAQQFASGRSIADYVRAAGGTTQDADRSRIFFVSPDGSARQISSAASVEAIPPGSAIIVPRDLRPFDFMEFARGLTQVLGNLAVSASAIAVISRD